MFDSEKKKLGRYVAVYTAIITLPIFFEIRKFTVIIDWIFGVMMCLLLFKGTLVLRIKKFIEVYLFTGILESMLRGIMVLLPIARLEGISGEIISILLTITVSCQICRQRYFKSFIKYLNALKKYQYIIVAISVVSASLFLAISESIVNSVDNKKIGMIFQTISVCLIGTVIIGIIWLAGSIYRQEYYVKQNQMQERVIQTQQQYYKKMYENEKEMRMFRHDIRAQFGCLQLLLSEGKLEEANEYLKTAADTFEKLTINKYHVGNEILDLIINQAYSTARKKEILLEVEGNMSRIDFINIYDLCSIFSNAINNAIEACERQPDIKKAIKCIILEHNGNFLFRFENPATSEMYNTVKRGNTSKENKKEHGFGIENIRMAVEKNNGRMEYLYSNEKLALEIYFAFHDKIPCLAT